jgi:hypothetical protein
MGHCPSGVRPQATASKCPQIAKLQVGCESTVTVAAGLLAQLGPELNDSVAQVGSTPSLVCGRATVAEMPKQGGIGVAESSSRQGHCFHRV